MDVGALEYQLCTSSSFVMSSVHSKNIYKYWKIPYHIMSCTFESKGNGTKRNISPLPLYFLCFHFFIKRQNGINKAHNQEQNIQGKRSQT